MLGRRWVLAGGMAVMAAPVLAQGLPDNISGTYTAEGRNADGSGYSGSVTVTESAGNIVEFAWQVGSQSYSGIGSRDGRVVTVSWGDTYPVVYVIMPDGALHGTWANGTALERLVK